MLWSNGSQRQGLAHRACLYACPTLGLHRASLLLSLSCSLAVAAPAAEQGTPEPQATTVLLFPVPHFEDQDPDVSAQLQAALLRAFDEHEDLSASLLSPELPAVKRAVREETVAPEALAHMTSNEVRQVLCQALGFGYGLVVEKLTLADQTAERPGPALTASLLRPEGSNSLALRSEFDEAQANVDPLSEEGLGILATNLVRAAMTHVYLTQPDDQVPASSRAERLLQQAAEQMAEGSYRVAVKTYSAALRLQPRNADLYFRLGNAYLALEDLDDAVVNYRRALYLEPSSAPTMIKLAQAYQKLGECRSLLETCRKLVKRHPDVAEHQQLLGDALLRQRDEFLNIGRRQEADQTFEEARKTYERAVELSADKLDILKPYATLLFENEEYAAATKATRDALKLRPSDAELRKLLWTSLLQDGEYKAAIDELLKERETNSKLRLEPDASLYKRLAVGIDRQAQQRFNEASKRRRELLAENLTREQFRRETAAFRDETDTMLELIRSIVPPKRYATVHDAREAVFTMMAQVATTDLDYAETLDELYASQAVTLESQAAGIFNQIQELKQKLS